MYSRPSAEGRVAPRTPKEPPDTTQEMGMGQMVLYTSGKPPKESTFSPHGNKKFLMVIWVWVKIKPQGDRSFKSLFPYTRVPCRAPIFDPQPNWDADAIGPFRRTVFGAPLVFGSGCTADLDESQRQRPVTNGVAPLRSSEKD